MRGNKGMKRAFEKCLSVLLAATLCFWAVPASALDADVSGNIAGGGFFSR